MQKLSSRACARCGGFFDVPKLESQLAALEERMSGADFWSNRERAQGDVEEVSRIRSLLTVGAPVYSTSIDRMMGRGGGPCGACGRADDAPNTAQMNATQVADSGGRIHPEKSFIG